MHTYETATQILYDCTHPCANSEVRMSATETRQVCVDCWNAHVAARREARKAQLAARPRDCARCGQRPHTWIYAGYRLCGRCKTTTEKEHNVSLQRAGMLAIFAHGLLVNTDTWAMHQTTTEPAA